MATLKAQHLAKSYKSRQVVRDVSLSIDSGQIVGLLGPNGAGKTTCFYMIVGLVQADQGRVLITDHNVRETLDICETAYIVNDGQLIAEGDAETILANKLVREVYLGNEFRL